MGQDISVDICFGALHFVVRCLWGVHVDPQPELERFVFTLFGLLDRFCSDHSEGGGHGGRSTCLDAADCRG